jgi:hypothetical protein
MANIFGDQAVKTCLRVFEYINKRIKYDAEMMELIVCSNIIRERMPTPEEERRIWLSYMDKE